MLEHAWPGNVRELRNVMERAVLVADGDQLTSAHVTIAAPATRAAASTPLADELDAMERQRIVDALAACNGNQTRAAELLGMPRRTLVKRLGQYGVPRPRKS
jgi:DNA-binding NtrC family response regulator